MNKLLKFRVWDVVNREFTYSGNKQFLISLDGKLYDGNGCSYDENHVIQQYTGIKDKDGREIYEGDIVCVMDENNIFTVEFGKINRSIVGYDTNTIYPVEIICFHFKQDNLPYFSITNNYLKEHDLLRTTVIGNVFENPDLIE